MQVKMHTEKTFELILTDSESQDVRRIAKKARVEPARLLECFLNSSLWSASGQNSDPGGPPWNPELDEDGNELSG